MPLAPASIIRHIVSDRRVPLAEQLQSHRLFATNFPRYLRPGHRSRFRRQGLSPLPVFLPKYNCMPPEFLFCSEKSAPLTYVSSSAPFFKLFFCERGGRTCLHPPAS